MGGATDAVARGVCGHCGAELAAHSASEIPASLPAIDISKLASLDEVTGASPPVVPAHPTAMPPSEPLGSPERFAPPPESLAPPDIDPADQEVIGVERSTRAIRIENQWRREKSQLTELPPLPPPQTLFTRSRGPSWRTIRLVLRLVVLVGALIGGTAGVVSWSRHHDVRRSELVQTGPSTTAVDTISIRVVAHEPIDVTIDGTPVGKTPLTMHVRKALQAVIVAAGGRVYSVVPDRDQLVDVSAP